MAISAGRSFTVLTSDERQHVCAFGRRLYNIFRTTSWQLCINDVAGAISSEYRTLFDEWFDRIGFIMQTRRPLAVILLIYPAAGVTLTIVTTLLLIVYRHFSLNFHQPFWLI